MQNLNFYVRMLKSVVAVSPALILIWIFLSFSLHLVFLYISFWHQMSFFSLGILYVDIFFKKWANPGLFLIYFRLFKGTLQILQQIGMRKYPIYNAGIRSLVNLNSLLHQWDYLGAEGPKDVLFNRKMPLWVIQERGLGDSQTGIIFNLTLASCSLESNNIQSFITCPRVGNWTPIVSWPRSRVVNFLSSGWKINEVSWERIFIYHWTKLVIE